MIVTNGVSLILWIQCLGMNAIRHLLASEYFLLLGKPRIFLSFDNPIGG